MAMLTEVLKAKTESGALTWRASPYSGLFSPVSVSASVGDHKVTILDFYDKEPRLKVTGPGGVDVKIIAATPDIIILREIILSETMANFMEKLGNL
jgi:hypothetical protein